MNSLDVLHPDATALTPGDVVLGNGTPPSTSGPTRTTTKGRRPPSHTCAPPRKKKWLRAGSRTRAHLAPTPRALQHAHLRCFLRTGTNGDVWGSGVVGGRARRAWMGLAGVVCAGEAEANYGWLPKRSPSHNPAKGDRGNLISHVTLQRQSHGTFQSRRSRARASPMGRRKRRPNPFFRLTRTAPCAPRPPSSSLRSRGSGSCARSLGQSNQTSRPMCGNTASLVAMTARSTEFSGS